MKPTILFLFLAVSAQQLMAQSIKPKSKFNFFNRTSLSYAIGINETFPEEKLNVFQVKTTFGKQSEHLGLGIGIATGSYKNISSSKGANFQTISFTGNVHYLLRQSSDERNNIFINAGAGYSPSFFNSYDEGFVYNVSTGYILKTRKGAKYFTSIEFQEQFFDKFRGQNHQHLSVQSIGLNIGTWF